MSSQVKDCYLAINGKKHGPYSESDLQALFTKDKITGSTLFVRKGMKEWSPLSEAGILKDEDGVPILPDCDEDEGEQESAWVKFFGDSIISKIVAFFICYAIIHFLIQTVWNMAFG